MINTEIAMGIRDHEVRGRGRFRWRYTFGWPFGNRHMGGLWCLVGILLFDWDVWSVVRRVGPRVVAWKVQLGKCTSENRVSWEATS